MFHDSVADATDRAIQWRGSPPIGQTLLLEFI